MLGENTIKKLFSTNKKKMKRIAKKWKEIKLKFIPYKINKRIDSTRLMAGLFLYLIDNPAEGTHRIKCEYEHGNKYRKHVGK